MSLHPEGAAAATEAPAPKMGAAPDLVQCPACARSVRSAELVTIEHPGPWETIDMSDLRAKLRAEGIAAADGLGDASCRIVRIEVVGCHHCAKRPAMTAD